MDIILEVLISTIWTLRVKEIFQTLSTPGPWTYRSVSPRPHLRSEWGKAEFRNPPSLSILLGCSVPCRPLNLALSFIITNWKSISWTGYVCTGICIDQGLAAKTRIKFQQKSIYNGIWNGLQYYREDWRNHLGRTTLTPITRPPWQLLSPLQASVTRTRTFLPLLTGSSHVGKPPPLLPATELYSICYDPNQHDRYPRTCLSSPTS